MIVTTSSRDVNTRNGSVFVEGLQHWQCPHCDAQVETPDQLDFNSNLIRAELKRIRSVARQGSKLLSGDQIKSLRTRFRLTQKLAAELFGGGPVAFSKYESEDINQSVAMNRLLELCLVDNPENIAHIAKRYEVSLSPETLLAIEANIPDRIALRRYGIKAYESLFGAALSELPAYSDAANECLYARFEKSPQRDKARLEDVALWVA
jgi:putative zinc finger/helix-turn-helix YgiT family protein